MKNLVEVAFLISRCLDMADIREEHGKGKTPKEKRTARFVLGIQLRTV